MMPIHSHSALIPDLLPGLSHRTLAGPEHGLTQLAVWSQRLAPGAATPPHRHDCEEAVVVLAGEGTLSLDGRESRFVAGDTVIVPKNALHQIVNTGASDLSVIAAFSMSPVQAHFPDGRRITLPWQDSPADS